MGHHPMGFGADPNPRFVSERLVGSDALVMGATAERIHDRFPALTKERSDRFALRSQQKAQAAYEAGQIQPDLVTVATRSPEGWGLADRDEVMRPETTMEGLAALRTPFRPHGNVTAGNAAGLNDGATASLIASEEAAKELGLPVKMKLVSFAFAGVEPEVMGIGPIPSTEKALVKGGLTIDDIGLFELNEAFAVQVLSLLDHFGIDDEDPRVNQWGGAIAFGHPLASSGVRLMIQLARQFEQHPEVRYGLTAMCIGLGQGGSVIWENPHFDKRAAKKAQDQGGGQVTDVLTERRRPRRAERGRGRHRGLREGRPAAGRRRARARHARQRPRPHPARTRSGRAACSRSRPCCSPRRSAPPAARSSGSRSPASRSSSPPVPTSRRRSAIPSRATAKQLAQLGHRVLGHLGDLGVPTFVFINGLALGGGLELPLNADYRTIDAVRARGRVPRGVPRDHPGLGRLHDPPEPHRHRGGPEGHRREPAEAEPHAHRAAGVRPRHRRRDPPLHRLPRAVDRLGGRRDRRPGEGRAPARARACSSAP